MSSLDSPSTPRQLQDLPVNLKRRIVELCAEQDEIYRDWSKKRCFEDEFALNKSHVVHGRSVSMLFQVNKKFAELAAPFLFRTLKSSKVDFPFKCCVAPARMGLIKTLELDNGSTDIVPYLRGLAPNVRKLILSQVALNQLFGYNRVVSFNEASLAGSREPATYAALGLRAFRGLNELCARSVPLESLDPFVMHNVASLRKLDLTLSKGAQGPALFDILASAQHLSAVSLTCLIDTIPRPFDLTPPSNPSFPCLRSLSITSYLLHASHFTFAAVFSASLKHLSLKSAREHTDDSGTFVQPQLGNEVFPKLTSFSFAGHDELTFETVSSIDANKHFPNLRRVEMNIVGIIIWDLEDSYLPPFESAQRLSTLVIPNPDHLPDVAIDDIEAFCDLKGVELEQRRDRFELFSVTSEVEGGDSISSLAGGIARTLEYVASEVEKAKEKGDEAALTRLEGVLQTVEAERVAGKVWEAV